MTELEKRKKVIDIALSKVGIKENPPNSNNVIFNTLFYGREVRDGDKAGAIYPWCGTFCSEIFQEAGIPLGNIGYRRGFAGCPYALGLLKDKDVKKQWGKEISFAEAQSGDLCFFDWQQDKKFDHVGILKSKNILANTFQAIEGNTSIANDSNGGEVMERTRKYFGGVRFIRPNIYGI